eukprot:TRINITY_DN13941_c0_g1_i2.p1 TRINITY_DN13941_c0_g1~~TRINITY_DN13941_c0_g1_i2.p1  ORF type:complete len:558 (+),score=56.86 TRINITY_DN13941_c0_g1_i2:45-1718(+)
MEEEKKKQAFLSWLNAAEGTTINDSIDLHFFGEENGGWGIVATKPIEPGETLVEIPDSLFLTFHTALNDPDIGPQLCEVCHLEEDAANCPNPREVLTEDEVTCIYLIKRFYHSNEPLNPWEALLPRQTDTTLFYTDKEVEQLSPLLRDYTEQQKQLVESKYSAIKTVLLERYPAVFPAEVYTYERYQWAYTLLESRRFVMHRCHPYLLQREVGAPTETGADAAISSVREELWGDESSEDDDDEPEPQSQSSPAVDTQTPQQNSNDSDDAANDLQLDKASNCSSISQSVGEEDVVVPMCDMFNHDTIKGELHFQYYPDKKLFAVLVSKPYQPGQQIFINYQKRYSNYSLLLFYGFHSESVLDNDCICLTGLNFTSCGDSETVETPELLQRKAQWVELLEIEENPRRLRVYPKRLGSTLLCGLRIKFLTWEEAVKFNGSPVSLVNELRVYKFILNLLKAKMVLWQTQDMRDDTLAEIQHAAQPTSVYRKSCIQFVKSIEQKVVAAALNNLAIHFWRLCKPQESTKADTSTFSEWIIEFILSCRELGIPVEMVVRRPCSS